MESEIEELNIKRQFANERNKILYLSLRSNIIKYSIYNCIADYQKIGLSQAEIDCIKNRTYTYILAYKDFHKNQTNNLEYFYKREDYL